MASPPSQIHERSLPFPKVLTVCVPYVLSAVFCSIFTVNELKKRFKDHAPFKSTTLRVLSFLSITSGFSRACFVMLFRVNGLCYFMGRISVFILYFQPIFTGLYALNRLHFLFADNKVQNGYSNALFMSMTVVAVLYALSAIAMEIATSIPKECGWRADHHFYYEDHYLLDDIQHGIWYSVNIGVYLLWDLCILPHMAQELPSSSIHFQSPPTPTPSFILNGV